MLSLQVYSITEDVHDLCPDLAEVWASGQPLQPLCQCWTLCRVQLIAALQETQATEDNDISQCQFRPHQELALILFRVYRSVVNIVAQKCRQTGG